MRGAGYFQTVELCNANDYHHLIVIMMLVHKVEVMTAVAGACIAA